MTIEIEVKETAVFAKITRKEITEYLETQEGWEKYKELDTHTIWINANCFYDEEHARFDIPTRDVPDWGWICKKGVQWMARAEGVTVLDMLMRFGVLNVQGVLGDMWSWVDDVNQVSSDYPLGWQDLVDATRLIGSQIRGVGTSNLMKLLKNIRELLILYNYWHNGRLWIKAKEGDVLFDNRHYEIVDHRGAFFDEVCGEIIIAEKHRLPKVSDYGEYTADVIFYRDREGTILESLGFRKDQIESARNTKRMEQ